MPQFKVPRLKGKSKKPQGALPCAAELMTVLNCWAASDDVLSSSRCLHSAQTLEACMASFKSGKKSSQSSFNRDLARLSERG